jgi:hypothetical protein
MAPMMWSAWVSNHARFGKDWYQEMIDGPHKTRMVRMVHIIHYPPLGIYILLLGNGHYADHADHRDHSTGGGIIDVCELV